MAPAPIGVAMRHTADVHICLDIDPEYGVMPKSNQLVIAMNFSSWQYPASKYTSQLRQAEEELGRTFFVPGERNMPNEIALATDSLSLQASFPNEDQIKRDALSRLGDAISQELPVTQLERIDLATGKHIDYIYRPIDPVIVKWCNSGADRWTAVIREQRNGPWIGVRPASQ